MSECYDAAESRVPSGFLEALRWVMMKPFLHLHPCEVTIVFQDIVHYDRTVDRAQFVFGGGDRAGSHHGREVHIEVYRHQIE